VVIGLVLDGRARPASPWSRRWHYQSTSPGLRRPGRCPWRWRVRPGQPGPSRAPRLDDLGLAQVDGRLQQRIVVGGVADRVGAGNSVRAGQRHVGTREEQGSMIRRYSIRRYSIRRNRHAGDRAMCRG
jgi:hypothetical protein